jgi:hypothetical protein
VIILVVANNTVDKYVNVRAVMTVSIIHNVRAYQDMKNESVVISLNVVLGRILMIIGLIVILTILVVGKE